MIGSSAPAMLGFGAASIGNLYRAMSDDMAASTVRAAWAAGLRSFDTAPHYGFGLSEKRLGAALGELDPGATAILSTKVGRRLAPARRADLGSARQGFISPEPLESVFDYRHDAVLRSHEDSRARLQRGIDILYAHDVGRFAHGDDHPRRLAEFLDGGYRAMRSLRDEGTIRAIGLGVNETAVCEEVLGHADLDIILLAGRYTLLEQDPLDSLLPLCARRNVRIVVGGPYNSGILATGVRHGGTAHYDYAPAAPAIVARVRAIEDVCAAHGVPLAAAALQFPAAHPQVVSVVPGMASPDQVAEAVRLMAFPIPSGLWSDLRTAGLIRPDAPVPAAPLVTA